MNYRFEFNPYRRKFKRPLQTNHGTWTVRKGIILHLTDTSGRVGLGEIAPVSWLGSETFEEALEFCRQLKSEISPETIFSIPSNLPACQFGFESALSSDKTLWTLDLGKELTYSGLLPAGRSALLSRKILWHQGYRTFKWKIGVAPIEEELEIFEQLVKAFSQEASKEEAAEPALLRLDANGGLNYPREVNLWLQACDDAGGIVEFIEQPFPVALGAKTLPVGAAGGETVRVGRLSPDRQKIDLGRKRLARGAKPLPLAAMLDLSDRYSTPLALDETVATLPQLKIAYDLGWRGIFVIKPSIAGSPSQLREVCESRQIDAVFSSVFETEIGTEAALRLAADLKPKRAVGFGVSHWFE